MDQNENEDPNESYVSELDDEELCKPSKVIEFDEKDYKIR